MLIDMHAHTSGISTCCRKSAPEVVKIARETGMDGIVLTNHYHKPYIKDGDFKGFAERYYAEYEYTRQCGEDIGCKVFFGIELSMELYDRSHFLIYGVGRDFLMAHPQMTDYTQERLYELVRAEGGALVQAHPYRKNQNRLYDTALLDGVEINCHPLYEGTHAAEMQEIAHRTGLILTCGGDYHGDTHRPGCGMYLPDDIRGEELGAYLKTASLVKLCVQEVDSRQSYDLLFERQQKREAR